VADFKFSECGSYSFLSGQDIPPGSVSPLVLRLLGGLKATEHLLDVWCATGGGEVHRTGTDTYRGHAFWRNRDGLNVSLDANRNVCHDFVNDAGGGVLAS
jgi:hypothetical protein